MKKPYLQTIIAIIGILLSLNLALASLDSPVLPDDPVVGLIRKMRGADLLGKAGDLYSDSNLTRRTVANLLAVGLRAIEVADKPPLGREEMILLSRQISLYDQELAILFSEDLASLSRKVIALDRFIKDEQEPNTAYGEDRKKRDLLKKIQDEAQDIAFMTTVSASFVDTSATHVLLTLFSETPFNLLISDECKEKVTVQLKNVSLYDAFMAVSDKANFAWQLDKRMIKIFPKKTVVQEKFEIKNLSQADAEAFFNKWKSPAGILQKDPTGQGFFLNDTWESIEKIRVLLADFDAHRPELEEVVEIINMRYSEPSEIHRLVSSFLSPKGRIEVNQRMKSLIVRDELRNVERIKELISRLDVQNEIIAHNTEIIRLKYSKASDILTLLRSEAFKSKEADGNLGMVGDERTNSIIVTGIPRRVVEIKRYIEKLDARVKQVSIKAKILEVTLNNSMVNGVDWETLIPTVVAKKSNGGGDINSSKQNYLDINLSSGGSQKMQFGTLDYEQFRILVDFLEARSNVKTVSTPTIITTDNNPAEINLGATIVFKLTGSEQSSVQQQSTGIKLSVTPSINPDNYITLDVNPEVSSPGSATETGDLTIDQLNMHTKVVVKDRETLLMGGLIKETDGFVSRRVPVLGSLPVVGNLFKDRNKNAERKEIVLFITPRIIAMESDSMNEAQRKLYFEN